MSIHRSATLLVGLNPLWPPIQINPNKSKAMIQIIPKIKDWSSSDVMHIKKIIYLKWKTEELIYFLQNLTQIQILDSLCGSGSRYVERD